MFFPPNTETLRVEWRNTMLCFVLFSQRGHKLINFSEWESNSQPQRLQSKALMLLIVNAAVIFIYYDVALYDTEACIAAL